MTERRYIELMNAEIDGLNTPERSAELRRYIDSHPDAARHFEELLEVARVLREAEEHAPPSYLRRSIMEVVAARAAGRRVAGETAGRRRGSFGSASLRDRLGLGPRARYALAFAGGIAVGMIVLTILALSVPEMAPLDRSLLYGALGLGGDRCAVRSAPVEFDSPGVSGRARVIYCAEHILVELDLSSREEVSAVLHYDESVGFEEIRALRAADHSFRAVGSGAELRHSGDGSYEIVLTDYTESRPPISLRVTSDGELLFEETLSPERDRPRP